MSCNYCVMNVKLDCDSPILANYKMYVKYRREFANLEFYYTLNLQY